MRSIEIQNNTTTHNTLTSKNYNLQKRIAPDEKVSFDVEEEVFDDIVGELVNLDNQSFGKQKSYDVTVN